MLKDDPIRLEVHRYRSEPKLPADLCPLQDFWKKNSSNSNRSSPKGGIRSEVAVCDASEQNESDSDSEERTPVSYTHLTLPTKA